MSIQSVQSSIANGAKSAGTAISNGAKWIGRTFTTYAVPALQKTWAMTQSLARSALAAAKAGPVYPFVAAAALFGIGIAAFSCEDNVDDEDSCAVVAWKVAGIVCFAAATAAVGIGIAALVV